MVERKAVRDTGAGNQQETGLNAEVGDLWSRLSGKSGAGTAPAERTDVRVRESTPTAGKGAERARPLETRTAERGGEVSQTLNTMTIPEKHKQMIVVTSDGWGSGSGTLHLYERVNGAWQPSGQQWPISLGKNGMGWGRGSLEGRQSGPEKNEGDKKSPAGVFELGSAFGYADAPPSGTRMPYKQATERDYFVDDSSSPDYNKWVTLRPGENPNERWRSYERMRMQTDQYKLGIVVNHNMPAVPDKGSAIFMHVWSRPGGATVGCTAMSEDNMRRLLNWIDPSQKPLLMQVPSDALPQLKGKSVRSR